MNKFIQYFITFFISLIQKEKETMPHIHCMKFFTQQQPLEIYTVVNPCIYEKLVINLGLK